jgi:hypothetical protein
VLAEGSEIGLGFFALTIGLFETRNTPGEKAAVFSKPILFNCSVGTAIRNKRSAPSQPASAFSHLQPTTSRVKRTAQSFAENRDRRLQRCQRDRSDEGAREEIDHAHRFIFSNQLPRGFRPATLSAGLSNDFAFENLRHS